MLQDEKFPQCQERGCGVGRGLGVGEHLPVHGVGVGVGVGVAVGVGDARVLSSRRRRCSPQLETSENDWVDLLPRRARPSPQKPTAEVGKKRS